MSGNGYELDVRRVRDAAKGGQVAAGLLRESAAQAVAERGVFTLAIPGGSSPRTVFAELADPEAAGEFPWDRTHLFWVDERAVPIGHADSNYGSFASQVLPGLPIKSDRVHRMKGELGPVGGAADYARTMMAVLGEGGTLDAVLLGVGEDGHVASLFPGADELSADGTVIGITDSPKPPPERITLTMPVLRSAKLVVVLGFGAGKADAVSRCLAGEPLPAGLASRGSGAVWVVDEAAAGETESNS